MKYATALILAVATTACSAAAVEPPAARRLSIEQLIDIKGDSPLGSDRSPITEVVGASTVRQAAATTGCVVGTVPVIWGLSPPPGDCPRLQLDSSPSPERVE